MSVSKKTDGLADQGGLDDGALANVVGGAGAPVSKKPDDLTTAHHAPPPPPDTPPDTISTGHDRSPIGNNAYTQAQGGVSSNPGGTSPAVTVESPGTAEQVPTSGPQQAVWVTVPGTRGEPN